MKVKVIKKKDSGASVEKITDLAARRSSRQSARKMVATVGDWVNEFKLRKQVETRAAIELLMQPNPQTSGS